MAGHNSTKYSMLVCPEKPVIRQWRTFLPFVCMGEVSVLASDTEPMDDGRPTSAASVGPGEGWLPILGRTFVWPG